MPELLTELQVMDALEASESEIPQPELPDSDWLDEEDEYLPDLRIAGVY